MTVCVLFGSKRLKSVLLIFLACSSLMYTSVALAREWVDSTGKFRVQAEYVSHRDETVQIRRSDGKLVSVPIRRLSEPDRDYVLTKVMNTEGAKSSGEPKPKSAAVLLAALRRRPTAENYLAIRSVLMNGEHYDPYSTDIGELEQLCEEKQFARVLKMVSRNENLWLSPWAHLQASKAARMLRQQARAKREATLMAACLAGIQATGDGSRERPFVVTRVSDEYDLINSLGKKMSEQRLVSGDGGKYFDALDCADGTTVWFDISDILARNLLQQVNTR